MFTNWYKASLTIKLPVIATLLGSSVVLGDNVEWFNHTMEAEWWATVGDVTTIDFTGHEHFEPLTDQYALLGVTFSGTVSAINSGLFINDEWGFRGFMGAWVHFDSPMNWIGADFPGSLAFALYLDGELIYESFNFGANPTGNFAGLVSEKPFDSVYFFRHPPSENIVFVDDLHFGAMTVPAPGVLGIFALALLANRRRRRC